MKYEMKFFIADNTINKWMEQADLNPSHKCFVSEVNTTSFETARKIDSKYIMNIISFSKNHSDFWIPAIEFCGQLYVSPEIKEISNGREVFFVQKQEARKIKQRKRI